MRVSVVIPTRFNVEGLCRLAPSIIEEATKIYIMDNGLSDEAIRIVSHAYRANGNIVPCRNLSIYEMWNLGQDIAVRDLGEHYTAIFNDDIYIRHGTLTKLAEAMYSDLNIGAISPDYNACDETAPPRIEFVRSTFGHGGLAGFAFMIQSSLNIRVDTNFKWWYGDDDLVKQIEQQNRRVAILRNVPVGHSPGTSASKIPEIGNWIAQDRVYFNNKYGENRR